MSPRHPGAIATTVAVVLSLALTQVAAAAGQPDSGFGHGGLASPSGDPSIPFGLGARAGAVALAPDGRIVVAGTEGANTALGESVLTARFTSAGVADPSFAGGLGRGDMLGSGAPPQRAGAVAVQADGSTIVAGIAGQQWALARFDPAGVTDGLFGAAGVTLRDPTPNDDTDDDHPADEPTLPDGTGPAAIALQSDGHIVVAGSVRVSNDDGVPSEQVAIARFDGRGVPDPGFGNGGFAVLQLGFGSAIRHASSTARGLVLLPDGRIVVAGRASARDGGDRAFVARLTSAGRLDASFGHQGRLLVQLGRASAAGVASSAIYALAQRPDGRLVGAGRATDAAGDDDVLLAAFTPGGALDTGFGARGSRVTQLGRAAATGAAPVSLARALALQPDGTAVVAGAASGGTLAARYGPSGAFDCSYGTRGRTLAFTGAGFDPLTDGAFGAVRQPDGRLVVAGRRAGGGVLLGRLDATAGAAARAGSARLVTLPARYTGHGRGYAYGLVDDGCSSVNVRFSMRSASGRTVKTNVQRVFGRGGPQVVCAPVKGLRPGGRYRIRVATTAGGPHGADRVLRAVKLNHRKVLAQEGCS
ncbi:MAG TPA: hypothetical protein VGF63_02215 [Solirubrobacteraceae bacterium]